MYECRILILIMWIDADVLICLMVFNLSAAIIEWKKLLWKNCKSRVVLIARNIAEYLVLMFVPKMHGYTTARYMRETWY